MILGMTMACLLGVSLYLLVDYKMYVRPWRMLAAALIALVLGQGLVISTESLEATLRQISQPAHGIVSLKNEFSLLNTVISALGGALIGAAVSNKAALLHSRERRRVDAAIASIKMRLDAVKSRNASGEPGDEMMTQLVTELLDLERQRNFLD